LIAKNPVGPDASPQDLAHSLSGARTTRFCRTQITPVVCATAPLTVSRPARPFAPMRPASTTSHPACRDDRDSAPRLGLGWSQYAIIPNCGKANYFRADRLTLLWRVLPVGQRKEWCARPAMTPDQTPERPRRCAQIQSPASASATPLALHSPSTPRRRQFPRRAPLRCRAPRHRSR